MKQHIHPDWHHDTVVTCACGNKFETGSVQKTIEVDICAACHPFFTGEMKFVDRQGRVDKFKKKMAVAQAAQKKVADNKKSGKKQDDADDQKSYQQLLSEEKIRLKKAARETDN